MMMKKLLITGFEPFGGEEINFSWGRCLPDEIGEYTLTKLREESFDLGLEFFHSKTSFHENYEIII